MGKVLFTVVILLIAGCKNKLTEGVVIDKWYEYANSSTIVEYNTALKMTTTRIVHDDEDFVLIVEGTHKSKKLKERFEVSCSDYNSANIGDSVYFE